MIEVPAVPVEEVTLIKPSEAVRLGSLGITQEFSSTVVMDGNRAVTGCALVAMWAGYGPDETGASPAYSGWHHVLMNTHLRACPQFACPEEVYDVRRGVIHLNDKHHWTFGQIADWLEGNGL